MFISLLGILFDYEVMGFKFSLFIPDVIISVLLVALVQWFCSNNGFAISWLVTIILVICYFSSIYLWRTKDPVFMEIIDEEKNKKIM
jgi:hypothetical protein